MRMNILSLAIFFFAFIALYTLLQNETFYRSTLGKFAANWANIDGERKLINEPFLKPTHTNYIQWDAVNYKLIRDGGYCLEKAGGDFIFAFFPLFPFLWKISGVPPIGILVLNYLLFALGLLLLFKLLSPEKSARNHTLFRIAFITPALVVYLLPYTEATFLLTGAIGLYGIVKKKYSVYFIGFYLAALTRPSFSFLMLSLIGVEFLQLLKNKRVLPFLKGVFLRLLPLLLGTLTVAFIQSRYAGGGMFTFVEVQKYWNHVLRLPTALQDWSHEGFGMSLGIIALIAVPILLVLTKIFLFQLLPNKRKAAVSFSEYTPIQYVQLLSSLYLAGNFLFVVFYQGGCLNSLSRYMLCTPFFFCLLFSSFGYIEKSSKLIRLLIFAFFSITALLVLNHASYSSVWNFSDLGFFIMLLLVFFWLFQDLSGSKFYKVGLYSLLFINSIWTAYLFDMYLSNGWIYT